MIKDINVHTAFPYWKIRRVGRAPTYNFLLKPPMTYTVYFPDWKDDMSARCTGNATPANRNILTLRIQNQSP